MIQGYPEFREGLAIALGGGITTNQVTAYGPGRWHNGLAPANGTIVSPFGPAWSWNRGTNTGFRSNIRPGAAGMAQHSMIMLYRQPDFAASTNERFFHTQETANVGFAYWLLVNAGGTLGTFSFSASGVADYSLSNAVIAENTWYVLGASIQHNGVSRGYINGAPQLSPTTGTGAAVGTAEVCFGTIPYSPQQTPNAEIPWAFWWPMRYLSAAEHMFYASALLANKNPFLARRRRVYFAPAAAGGFESTTLNAAGATTGALSTALISASVLSATGASTSTLATSSQLFTALSSAGASTATLEAAAITGGVEATDLSAAGAATGTLAAAAILRSDLTSTGAATATLVGAAVDNSAPTDLSAAGAATGTLAAAMLSASTLTATGASTATLEAVAFSNAVTTDLSAAGASTATMAGASIMRGALSADGESTATLYTREAEQNAYLRWGSIAAERRRVLEDEDEEILSMIATLVPRLFKRGYRRDITYR